MLELNDIKKDYVSGSTTVSALKGINLRFRDCEFVSILGQSGCGKTTMLNIIGGLDKYTSGDLKINGVSTKNYKDRDWDFYRNNSIGFVFQSYNLIPHQTVLSNVELALTLSGVSKAERKKRAIEALEKVGLGEQIHKKPNQMSGGQKQRLSIARAIARNPRIFIFDDSFSALDLKTDAALRKALASKVTDSTVIIVAQRISTILHAEQILVMDEGRIVGKGTHEELMRNCEVYQQIARSQLSASELENSVAVKEKLNKSDEEASYNARHNISDGKEEA